MIAAILGTREGAVEAGLRLYSVGVTCPDDTSAAALRDALAAHKLENVMLVSAFLAAAALGQAIGGAVGYERTAVLFVEPDAATLAVVDTANGSVSEVCRAAAFPGRRHGGGRGGRHGRRRRVDAVPSRRCVRGGHWRRRCSDQARARRGDVADGECAGGRRDGVGSGCGAGVGQRAVVRFLHRGSGVCAGFARSRPSW
ncbi:DUF7159 family protein [Mycobacterium ostraviense]|uniref:DUF7159 family protein n=1 Tax=Mycobacterium ostraviense TaxID=2738409 RepID=UPI003B8A8352